MNPVCVQTIYVSSLPEAIDFYARALGYEVKARYGECIAQLRTGGVTLILQEMEKGQTVPPAPTAVLAFRTEDIAKSMSEVVAAGGELLHTEPQPCPVGKYAAFRDRSGVLLELLQFTDA